MHGVEHMIRFHNPLNISDLLIKPKRGHFFYQGFVEEVTKDFEELGC
jgi:hypothetical protein